MKITKTSYTGINKDIEEWDVSYDGFFFGFLFLLYIPTILFGIAYLWGTVK
jgi:hypothetical protein